MKRWSLGAGAVILPIGWVLAGGGFGMTGHMAGHMLAVAVAAPLIAFALTGTRADPAKRWPRLVTPMGMMLVELGVVWTWHLPMLREAAHGSRFVMLSEQAMYLIAGLLLWSATIDTRNRAAGIGALLLTSMHMTLLGALIGLAPRPLYHGMHMADWLEPLADQQLGGVVMLMIGAVSYLLGGLAMLGQLLREPRKASA